MDLSTSAGAGVVTVLRLLHIVAGIIWVGAAVLISFYIEPAAEKAGAEGRGFLRQLYSGTGLPRLIPLSAFITTVAGLLLYGLLSYHEALSSSMGVVLTLGALFGLLAFAHGWFALWRGAGNYVELLRAEEASGLAEIEGKMRRNGRISMWLALVSLVLMAGARYIGPILG